MEINKDIILYERLTKKRMTAKIQFKYNCVHSCFSFRYENLLKNLVECRIKYTVYIKFIL